MGKKIIITKEQYNKILENLNNDFIEKSFKNETLNLSQKISSKVSSEFKKVNNSLPSSEKLKFENANILNKIPKAVLNRVNTLSKLIDKAIDSDGDKIGVVDPKGTAEIVTIYEKPIINNNILTIKEYEPYTNKKSEEVFDFNKDFNGDDWWIYDDSISYLNYLISLYKRTLKKHNITLESENETTLNEGLAVELIEFAQNVVDFLKDIITDSSSAGLSPFWQKLGVTRGELISTLLDLGIITAVSVKGVKNYKVYRNKLIRGIKELYNLIFKKEKEEPKNTFKNDVIREDEIDGKIEKYVGSEILNHPLISKLPEFRKDVDWVTKNGVWFPSIDIGYNTKVKIFSKEDIIGGDEYKYPSGHINKNMGYIGEFKESFNEEPIFIITKNAGEKSIFKISNDSYMNYFYPKKIKEETGAASSGAFVAPMGSEIIKKNRDSSPSVHLKEYEDVLDLPKLDKDLKGIVLADKRYGAFYVDRIKAVDRKPNSVTYLVTLKENGKLSDSHLLVYKNFKTGEEKVLFNFDYDKLLDAYKAFDIVFHKNLNNILNKVSEVNIDEETSTFSVGGSDGFFGYVTPKVWAKNKKNWRFAYKPIMKGGKIVGEDFRKLHPDADFVYFGGCVGYNNNTEALDGGCSQGAVDGVVRTSKKPPKK
jgi:hypothetical protein